MSSRSIAFLASGGAKASGSRKMSMSSENRWMRFQPLERLVPPLKIILSPASCGDDAQGLGDVVILLDDARDAGPGGGNARRP